MSPFDSACALLREHVSGLWAVYLFGSAARGEARPTSDLDLAVLAEAPMDPLARFDLQERIAYALRRDVDLVDFRSASTVMQAEILGASCLLLDLVPNRREHTEADALAAYALLNEERADILAAVRARGRVYARV